MDVGIPPEQFLGAHLGQAEQAETSDEDSGTARHLGVSNQSLGPLDTTHYTEHARNLRFGPTPAAINSLPSRPSGPYGPMGP